MNTTEKQTQISPLPWKIGSSNEVFPDGDGGEAFSEWLNVEDANGKVVCELPGHSQFARGSDLSRIEDANAAFLVRAANAHTDLVQALTLALPCVEYAEIETASQRLTTAHAKTVEALAHLRSALSKAKEA